MRPRSSWNYLWIPQFFRALPAAVETLWGGQAWGEEDMQKAGLQAARLCGWVPWHEANAAHAPYPNLPHISLRMLLLTHLTDDETEVQGC